MRKIQNLNATVAVLACALTAACSSGGGGGEFCSSRSDSGGRNQSSAQSIYGRRYTHLGHQRGSPGNGKYDTRHHAGEHGVAPARVDRIYTNSGVLADNYTEQGGATLTYKGTQTVNGMTGPVFQLDVPKMFVTQTLLPDGTGGPCCGFNDVNGKVNLLNYTMTGTWNAVNDGTTCSVCTSMFVTGFQTPSANVPAGGQATYLGNGANGSVSGNVYSGDGIIQTGTVSGSSSSFAVNFVSGQVTGTLSGLKVTPVSAAGVVGTSQDWNQINIAGSLSGAVLTGTTSTPSQPAGSLGFGVKNTMGTIGARCSDRTRKNLAPCGRCRTRPDTRPRSESSARQNNSGRKQMRREDVAAQIIATVLFLTGSCPCADAQQPSRSVGITGTEAAQLLIANNRLDDARRVLEQDLASQPDDSEALFLRATIAVAQKDYDTAISLYRRILVREPDAERVRLELARTFFLKGDYDNADRQFRFARAGDIDDTVKANIDHFLDAINRLREWTINFSLALAPDTNQNAATSAAQVNIFGLPFALDKNARKQSGIGVAGDIGGEWSPPLSDNVKARIGADLTRTGLQRRPVRRHDAVGLWRTAICVP